MKAVILAGGRGIRMGKMTENSPKPMIPIAGKPIMEYQIEQSKKYGINDISILLSYQSEKIQDYFGDGKDWGVNIVYNIEENPLGTAGALKEIEKDFNSDFLVFYGDIIMDMDLDSLFAFHAMNSPLATITVHPNDHPQDSDLVKINNENRVVNFISKPHDDNYYYRNLVNAALYVLSPSIFDFIEKGEYSDFGKTIFPRLISKGENIYAYNTTEYIKDIGTPERLQEVEKDLLSGHVRNLNKTKPQKAVFLDRDGVLNENIENLSKIDDFRLLPDTAESITFLNASDYISVVVTNQPVIAKGFATEEEICNLHAYMESLLGKEHAYIDRIYYCPHHPEKGFDGERIEYKIDCHCRKPDIEMITKASADMNISLENSFIIGDSTADILAGANAGLTSILVETGYGGKDGKYDCDPDFVFTDLSDAVRFITISYERIQNLLQKIIPRDMDPKNQYPIISIGGLSRSGKSTLARHIRLYLHKNDISAKILNLDNWLINLDERTAEMNVRDRYQYEKLIVDIKSLINGDTIIIKNYDPMSRTLNDELTEFKLESGEVLIIDGVVSLDIDIIRNLSDIKIYVEIAEKVRKQRFNKFYRLKGLSDEDINKLFLEREDDEHKIIINTMKYADHLINMASLQ